MMHTRTLIVFFLLVSVDAPCRSNSSPSKRPALRPRSGRKCPCRLHRSPVGHKSLRRSPESSGRSGGAAGFAESAYDLRGEGVVHARRRGGGRVVAAIRRGGCPVREGLPPLGTRAGTGSGCRGYLRRHCCCEVVLNRFECPQRVCCERARPCRQRLRCGRGRGGVENGIDDFFGPPAAVNGGEAGGGKVGKSSRERSIKGVALLLLLLSRVSRSKSSSGRWR